MVYLNSGLASEQGVLNTRYNLCSHYFELVKFNLFFNAFLHLDLLCERI